MTQSRKNEGVLYNGIPLREVVLKKKYLNSTHYCSEQIQNYLYLNGQYDEE